MKELKRSRIKRLLAIPVSAIILATSSLFGTAVSADDSVNNKVKEAEEGVYAIEMVYTDQNTGKKFPFQSGTAFFINDDTLITCCHVVSMSADMEKNVKAEANKRYKSFSNNNISVQVMLQSDVSIPATVVTSSADADWAVLQVSDALNTKPLKIGKSNEAQNTQSVYAIGYPSVVANWSSAKNFSKSDISTTKGQISKIYQKNGIDQIQHGATLSDGNSGGPLVDEQGAVIGVNAEKNRDNDYYFAIAMEQIVDVLDQRKISYTRVDGGTEPEVTTSATEQQSSETETKASDDDSKATTTKITENSKADPPTTAETKSSSKDGGMDTKTIIMIVAGAVVLILVIVIIIVAAGGKKKPKQVGYSQNRPQPTPPPQRPIAPQMPQQPMAPPQPQSSFPQQTMVNNVGETTVLTNNAVGETTVLGAVASPFSVVRKKTGEQVSINKAAFVMGKDTTADYCISNNTSISRNHAKVFVKNGQCYITDMRSTNGTFVNGSRVSPNQEVALKSGDVIRLSDEEFEFRA